MESATEAYASLANITDVGDNARFWRVPKTPNREEGDVSDIRYSKNLYLFEICKIYEITFQMTYHEPRSTVSMIHNDTLNM